MRDLAVLELEEMTTEPRVALIIGNSKYPNAPLKNPANDASDMAEVLENCGFYVILKLDSDAKGMTDAMREFGQRIQRGGVGVFYYAGHAVQVKGENFLIPVNSDITSEDEVPFEAVNASRVMAKMESAGNRVNIVILDACRNNPFSGSSRSSTRGLAKMDAARGTFVAYATSPGSVAADGDGRNGLYTQMLLKQLRLPGKKLEEVFKAVRTDVVTTAPDQVPWDSSSLTGEFFFRIPDSAQPSAARPVQTAMKSIESRGSKKWLWILLGGAAAGGAGAALLGGGGDVGAGAPTGTIEINVEAP
jgi:uncharacterized caspase-like protein